MEIITKTVDPLWHLKAIEEVCCSKCSGNYCNTCDMLKIKKWLKRLHEKGHFFKGDRISRERDDKKSRRKSKVSIFHSWREWKRRHKRKK